MTKGCKVLGSLRLRWVLEGFAGAGVLVTSCLFSVYMACIRFYKVTHDGSSCPPGDHGRLGLEG